MSEEELYICVFCGRKIEDIPTFISEGNTGYNFCDPKHLQLWQKNGLLTFPKITREEIETDFFQVIKSLSEMDLIHLLQIAYRFNYSETLFLEQYINAMYPDITTMTIKLVHERSYSKDGSLEVIK